MFSTAIPLLLVHCHICTQYSYICLSVYQALITYTVVGPFLPVHVELIWIKLSSPVQFLLNHSVTSNIKWSLCNHHRGCPCVTLSNPLYIMTVLIYWIRTSRPTQYPVQADFRKVCNMSHKKHKYRQISFYTRVMFLKNTAQVEHKISI